MSLLKEMLGGQRRIAPDRELIPRYTGKTIFTNRSPVPFIQRMAVVLFCLGFIGIFYALLDREIRFGKSLIDLLWGALLALGILVCAALAILAVLGTRPFQSKGR